MDVVVDMTREGRKVVHPDQEHPAYYLPVMSGLRWGTAAADGEHPPPVYYVAHLVAVALAAKALFAGAPQTARLSTGNEVIYADGTPVTVPEIPALIGRLF